MKSVLRSLLLRTWLPIGASILVAAFVIPSESAPLGFADSRTHSFGVAKMDRLAVTIDAAVNDPFQGSGALVCNQGIITGTNFANVLTDDPDTGSSSGPTCTPIDVVLPVDVVMLGDHTIHGIETA